MAETVEQTCFYAAGFETETGIHQWDNCINDGGEIPVFKVHISFILFLISS